MAALLYLRPFDLWVVQHIGIRVSSLLHGYDDNLSRLLLVSLYRKSLQYVCGVFFCLPSEVYAWPSVVCFGSNHLGCWLAGPWNVDWRLGVSLISSPSPIFEWPKHMNIDYFYLTNQMTASLSCNSFVTEDNQKLRNTVALSWLFITSITKELLLQESERRYFIGRNLNYAGSFEVDLPAMPVRPSRR